MISELRKIILNIVKALEKILMRRVTTVPPRNLLVITVYILENARDESTLSLGFFLKRHKNHPISEHTSKLLKGDYGNNVIG